MNALERLSDVCYTFCVDFVINLANLLGLTYDDVNFLLFLVAFPLTTLSLAAICIYQRKAVSRLEHSRRMPRR